ncbi:surface lipoprotein assembly modifier [Edwardsiella tarda]|uniref:surface lipoprotein assembly modifier n=1 Tax=Edwardsiella tarda TaxID=636 RepID=UPI00063BD4F1|nr:surface lipoprotein assembly modifier [Edwardsiella tarda]AKH88973.1 surface lipoprotein assembly modifier [Edwardsiella tarda]
MLIKIEAQLLQIGSAILLSILTMSAADAASAPQAVKNTLVISQEALKTQPHIIFQGMIQAVIKSDAAAVKILLPLYQAQPGYDENLAAWGKAILAKEEGNYRDAIRYYRRVIAKEPQLNIARLQLAIALFQNKDRASALLQFNKLRANSNGEVINEIVDSYIRAIQQKDSWSFNLGVNYINESNINNAPGTNVKIGPWQAEKRQSGQGFSYYLSASKTWSLPEGLFSEIRTLAYGKYFTNNHRYDQATARLSAGLGLRDLNASLLLLPFIEREWASDNQAPSLSSEGTSPGLRIETEYRLNPRWKIDVDAEKSHTTNKRRTQRDSKNHLLSTTLYYSSSPEQFWFWGSDYQRENVERKSLAFQRIKWRAGWGNEWPGGISSIMQINYANKFYDSADFFGIQQRNKEYGALITLWHRDIYYFGITPKINLSYFKSDSNHPFYEYDKKMAFLTFSKLF